MKPFLIRILRSGSAWGMASLGIRAASAAALIPLTAHHVPSHDLGFWYIFINIFAFVLVLDAGLSATIGRLIAARPDFSASSPEANAEALRFFGTVRWFYLLIGPLTFVLLSLLGGWWVWTKSSPGDLARVAWLIFCPSFAFSVAANLSRGLLFGINRLDLYNMLFTCAALAQFAIVVGGLLNGAGLYALIGGNLVLMGILALMLPLFLWMAPDARHALARGKRDGNTAASMLRVASGTFLNTVATYSVVNATLLIASLFLPLTVTASYGLTLQCFLLANQASSVWLEIKHPVYARLLAEDRPAMHRLFIARMRICIVTFLACTVALAALGNQLLAAIGAQTLLLPTGQLLVLGVFIALYAHHSHFEMVGLCLGKNPFTRAYLVAAGVGTTTVLLLTPWLGLWGALLGPLAVQLAFNNWWVPLQGMRLMTLSPREYLLGLAGLKSDHAK